MVSWRDMEKGRKFWCWWKSRYLWYTGRRWRGMYLFEDAGGCLIEIEAEKLKNLEVR